MGIYFSPDNLSLIKLTLLSWCQPVSTIAQDGGDSHAKRRGHVVPLWINYPRGFHLLTEILYILIIGMATLQYTGASFYGNYIS